MRIRTIASALLAVSCAAPALAGTDNFNRASLNVYQTWFVEAGKMFITNGEMQGTSGAQAFFMDADAVVAPSATAKIILHGTGLQYGAITIGLNQLGAGPEDLNAFVKLQSQGGTGLFDHLGFYTGNNGSGPFVALTAPMASPVTMTVSFFASLALVTLKNASTTQVYTYDYGRFPMTGSGTGTFGTVGIDNFTSPTPLAPAVVMQSALQALRIVGSDAADATH
jgi:hypothetical protein